MRKLTWVALCALASLAPIRGASAQVAGETPIGVTVEEMKVVVLGWSARNGLLGKDVYNDQNERIGEINDIIVSPKRTVSYAIIGVGGFLGVGEHDVAIPMNQITQNNEDKFILKGATKDVLNAMPEFKYGQT